MNIAIIGPAHPLRGGGISTFNERLAMVLQEAGHRAIIYSFSLQYPEFLFPGKSQFTDEPPPTGIGIVPLINSVNPLNWLRAGRQIAKTKPDLVVVRYWLPFMGPALGTILRLIRRNGHSKVVCIADNITPHEKRPGDLLFTKYFIPSVDRFVTMSKDVLRDVERLTTKPAVYTPHPLYDNYGEGVSKNEACARLGLKPDEQHVLFFGFIRKYKGLDLLLEAMQEKALQDSGVKLIVAGEYYGDSSMYQPLIEALGDRVHLFTQFIPNDEVRLYFSAADLIVQPYRSATQSGITQIAYHFRKPMVVTKVGGLHEVVNDGATGFVVNPEANEIAAAIARYFEQGIPGLEVHIEEARQRYSWSTFLQVLLADKRYQSTE